MPNHEQTHKVISTFCCSFLTWALMKAQAIHLVYAGEQQFWASRRENLPHPSAISRWGCFPRIFVWLSFIHSRCRAEHGKKVKKKKKGTQASRKPIESSNTCVITAEKQPYPWPIPIARGETADPPQSSVLGELGAEVRHEHPPACPELCTCTQCLQQQGNALGGSSATASQPPRAAIGFSFRSWK